MSARRPIATLFMVPWLAAGIRPGNAADNAPNNTSTMRIDVSTLPAATAAGARASTRLPGCVTICTQRNAPLAAGVWSGIRHRSAYQTAAAVTDNGQLILPGTCADVPEKSATTT